MVLRGTIPERSRGVGDRGRGRAPIVLAEHARVTARAVHAYVLMTSHVHLLLTPDDADAPSRLMQRVGQRFVKAVNRAYSRTGAMWEGRYRAMIATDEGYVLACCRYIEMNPVRARMVDHPRDFPWSSHRANVEGAPVGLLTPHERFQALGVDETARRIAYRELFREQLPERDLFLEGELLDFHGEWNHTLSPRPT